MASPRKPPDDGATKGKNERRKVAHASTQVQAVNEQRLADAVRAEVRKSDRVVSLQLDLAFLVSRKTARPHSELYD